MYLARSLASEHPRETRQSLQAPEEQITLMVLDPCSAAFVGVE
jgi:hypothetical protein